MLWWLQTQASELGCGATAASNPRQANLGAVLWWLHAPSKRTWVRCYGGFKPKASELACGTMVASNPKHAKLGAALWWQKTKASEIGCGVMANDIWVWCYGGKIPKQAKLSAVLWWPRKSHSKRSWGQCDGGKKAKASEIGCGAMVENPKASEIGCGAMVAKKIRKQTKMSAVLWWPRKSHSKRSWGQCDGGKKKPKQANLGAVLWWKNRKASEIGCGMVAKKIPQQAKLGAVRWWQKKQSKRNWVRCYGKRHLGAVLWWPRNPQQAKVGSVLWGRAGMSMSGLQERVDHEAQVPQAAKRIAAPASCCSTPHSSLQAAVKGFG